MLEHTTPNLDTSGEVVPTPVDDANNGQETSGIADTAKSPDTARAAEGASPVRKPGRSRLGLGIFGVVAIAGAAALVSTGISARQKSEVELQQWTEAQAIPSVTLVTLNAKPGVVSLNLPGRLQANDSAPIYARVSGYVKDWKVDIGASVKAGQTLAEIEAPDQDQQLLQAKADLANAKSAEVLADVTLKRERPLLQSQTVAQQEIDQRVADLASKQAAVSSGEANVERLEALSAYKTVAAPFDGLITQRNTDIGSLISAGSSAGLAMFVVSDVHTLRVYINVPQNYAPDVKLGSQATVSVPEYPGRSFPATVVASARSVDITSGTTQMQLSVDNAKGELMPGAYANVKVDLAGVAGTFRIPVSALIFDERGLRVATVAQDNRVAFKTVTIARDLGNEIELGSGVAADDHVIATPPDGLAEGDEIHIVELQQPKQTTPKAALAQ
ncbi:efflux RND transporter periplasmic adaptor subunit [Mesorhizobium carmichaelinearum]|uniref:efflux RND transporter periplasmic adaptor subunit n=1 Tax=Mesorhizobium carmichaelinearum TaxID=1208188 RepID=UPI000BA416CA|nr:efflux RND transporter periplasmic adaptor subunit [Mesorhizobium carmichaelinearum]